MHQRHLWRSRGRNFSDVRSCISLTGRPSLELAYWASTHTLALMRGRTDASTGVIRRLTGGGARIRGRDEPDVGFGGKTRFFTPRRARRQ